MAEKKKTKKKTDKKTKGKAPTSRKVSGVAIGKVKEELLDKYLADADLVTTGTVEEKVRRYAEWVKENVPSESLVDCTVCGGDSHEDCEVCPYCGEEGAIDTDGEEVAAPPKAAKAAKPAKAIVPAAPLDLGKAAKFKVGDLDKGVKQVAKLKAQAAKDLHALGVEILNLFKHELWKLRVSDGKPVHTNWKKFCAEELGMSHTYAYKLMDVANAFTDEDMKEIGTTKLGLALQVEEGPMRDKLLASARAGASASDIKQQVREVKSGAASTSD